MVFQEIPASRLALALPVRNPLAEVRWLAFLRGDAYVNLFQDLLYALARSHGPHRHPEVAARPRVGFTESGITVERPAGEPVHYPYEEVRSFRLDYTTLLQEQAVFRDGTQAGFFARLRLPAGVPQLWDYRLAMSRGRFLQLVDFLYARRVAFREFHGGTRSFRLKTNVGYRRVQELKEQYGIEW